MVRPPMPPPDPIEFFATSDHAGERIDAWLAIQLQAREDQPCSRSRTKQLIKEGHVQLNGSSCEKPNQRVQPDDRVLVTIPEPVALEIRPEPMDLNILFEDEHLIAVHKPAGLVVHPAAGNWTGTLVHGLLHHCGDELQGIGGAIRPGIVHRLDKDTSGVIIVAKTEPALRHLQAQFQAHTVRKTYTAVVRGIPDHLTGTIDVSIGRHPVERKKMMAGRPDGRSAVSHFEVVEKLDGHAVLSVRIETGRTHQIRVHCAHIGHPLVGDPVYGGRQKDPRVAKEKRQMLHATHLEFDHPVSGERMNLSAPLPKAMQRVIDRLRPSS